MWLIPKFKKKIHTKNTQTNIYSLAENILKHILQICNMHECIQYETDMAILLRKAIGKQYNKLDFPITFFNTDNE